MKNLLLGIALILPVQLFAADNSVYSWGAWAEGIKPAAGPVANITPAPAQKPQVNFRPNENSAFVRNNIPAANIDLPQPAAPAAPGHPQLPNIVVITTPSDSGAGSLF